MPTVTYIVRITNVTHQLGEPRVLSIDGSDITGSDGKGARLKVPVRSYTEIDLHEIQFDRLLLDWLSQWVDSGEAVVELNGAIKTSAQVSEWKYGVAADLPISGMVIKFNGVTVTNDIRTLNFINGPDRTDGDPGVSVAMNGVYASQGDLYIHPPNFASHFNTTDGNTVAIPASPQLQQLSKIRNVSKPGITPGGAFEITGWLPGSSHTGFHYSNPISFSTPGKFSLADLNSSILVEIYRADTTTLIANHFTSPIGLGGYSASQNGITIVVSDVTANSPKYAALLSVSLDVSTILAGVGLSGGKYRLVIHHQNGLETPLEFISDMFWDTNAPGSADDPTADHIGIGQSGIMHDKWLSGVRYYDLNTEFSVMVGTLRNVNNKSYPSDIISIDTTEYGIGSIPHVADAMDLTGWTSLWDGTSSYLKNAEIIDQVDYRFISGLGVSGAKITYQFLYTGVNWATHSALHPSTESLVCIDTWGISSTDLYEAFTDEARRLTAFDLSGAYSAGVVWDSTEDMSVYDTMDGAIVQNGELKKRRYDWSGHLPLGSPDYSVMLPTNTYYRRFISDGRAYRSVRFTFQVGTSGTLADLLDALQSGVGARLYMFIPGSPWRVRAALHAPFNFSSFNSDIRNGGVYTNSVVIGNFDVRDGMSIVASFGNTGLSVSNSILDVAIELDDDNLSIGSIDVQFQGA
jgi:hypothetical protein